MDTVDKHERSERNLFYLLARERHVETDLVLIFLVLAKYHTYLTCLTDNT